jgi:hypothetical protein
MKPSASVSQLALRPGTPVEVRARFDAAWKRGFEVVESQGATVRVRRISDGAVLPDFPAEDVRVAH